MIPALATLAVWVAVTLGGRGLLAGAGLIRCRFGDWGTAFLTGFSAFTLILYLAALVGAPIGAPLVLGSAGIVLLAGLARGRGAPSLPVTPTAPWTPAERVLFGGLLAYFAMVFLNAHFFPVMAMDAHSYDGRARFLVEDGRLDLALYHWPGNPISASTNITYPPLLSLGLAVAYALGATMSKTVIAGFAAAWPLLLYGVLRQSLPRFWTLVWVLVLALTPEVFSHASFALLNMPAMALLALEAVALERFLREGGRGWAGLAALAGAAAAGVRPDALVIHGVLVVTAGGFCVIRRDLPALIRLAAVALAPLLTWGTWTWMLGRILETGSGSPLSGDQAVGPNPVLRAAGSFLTHWGTFGLTFFLWMASLPFLARGAQGRYYRVATLGSLVAVVILYSLLDVGYGGGAQEFLNSSFKRALFYLVPLAGLAAALSLPWTRLAAMGRGVLWEKSSG